MADSPQGYKHKDSGEIVIPVPGSPYEKELQESDSWSKTTAKAADAAEVVEGPGAEAPASPKPSSK